jgi:hypothetical protein
MLGAGIADEDGATMVEKLHFAAPKTLLLDNVTGCPR